MAFDFDNYINKICIGEGTEEGIFGESAIYKPSVGSPVNLTLQFIKNYQRLEFSDANDLVTDTEIVCFLRYDDLGKEPKQDDVVEIQGIEYNVFEVQEFMPGARKLVLHKVLL